METIFFLCLFIHSTFVGVLVSPISTRVDRYLWLVSIFSEKLSALVDVFLPLVVIPGDGVRLVGVNTMTRGRAPCLNYRVASEK